MKGDAGFTLVELLAALFAGSLLLAIVGAMTGGLGRELLHGRRSTDFDQIAAVTPLLRSLLTSTSPTAGTFSGSAHSVEAEVSPPMALGGVGPLKMQLDVVSARDGEGLELSLESDDGPSDDRRLPLRRTLLHGFRSIAFDYGADQVANADTVPDLSGVTLTDRQGAEWTIAAAPRVNTAGGCKFDPISLACRS